jgi:hypothetical protein
VPASDGLHPTAFGHPYRSALIEDDTCSGWRMPLQAESLLRNPGFLNHLSPTFDV